MQQDQEIGVVLVARDRMTKQFQRVSKEAGDTGQEFWNLFNIIKTGVGAFALFSKRFRPLWGLLMRAAPILGAIYVAWKGLNFLFEAKAVQRAVERFKAWNEAMNRARLTAAVMGMTVQDTNQMLAAMNRTLNRSTAQAIAGNNRAMAEWLALDEDLRVSLGGVAEEIETNMGIPVQEAFAAMAEAIRTDSIEPLIQTFGGIVDESMEVDEAIKAIIATMATVDPTVWQDIEEQQERLVTRFDRVRVMLAKATAENEKTWLIWKNWFLDQFEGFMLFLYEPIYQVGNLLIAAFKFLGPQALGAFGKIGKQIGNLFMWLKDSIVIPFFLFITRSASGAVANIIGQLQYFGRWFMTFTTSTLPRYITNVVEFFTNAWRTAITAWPMFFRNALVSVQTFFRNFINNQIIPMLNWVIEKINSIKFTMPDIWGLPGRGETFGPNIPKLESYEHGGIVPGPRGAPTPVIAHGGEAFLGAGAGMITVQLVLDRRVIGEVAIDAVHRTARFKSGMESGSIGGPRGPAANMG